MLVLGAAAATANIVSNSDRTNDGGDIVVDGGTATDSAARDTLSRDDRVGTVDKLVINTVRRSPAALSIFVGTSVCG